MIKVKDPKVINEIYFAKGTTRALGQKYGLSRQAISNIKRNKSWKNVERINPEDTEGG